MKAVELSLKADERSRGPAASRAELMAKLDALTTLRVVRDAAASSGWKLDIGPFPGWKDTPTW